jgi:hypothetical protein
MDPSSKRAHQLPPVKKPEISGRIADIIEESYNDTKKSDLIRPYFYAQPTT